MESRAYLKLEIVLETSLIPKRTVSVLAKRCNCKQHHDTIMKLFLLGYQSISLLGQLSKRVGGAEKAIQDFHKEVGNVITLLLAEYRYIKPLSGIVIFTLLQKSYWRHYT